MSAPTTPEQASIVAEAVHAIEEQAEAEAQVEAEVAVLVEAIEQREPAAPCSPRNAGRKRQASESAAPEDAKPAAVTAGVAVAASPDAATVEPATESTRADDAAEEDREAAGSGDGGAEHGDEVTAIRNELSERRERLPESALALVEAIRQAAVSKQLTRQITRLLITAGDFSDDDVRLTVEHRRAAASVLGSVEQSLQKALEKESFGKKAQRELAERIRTRRKELERLLQETESDAG